MHLVSYFCERLIIFFSGLLIFFRKYFMEIILRLGVKQSGKQTTTNGPKYLAKSKVFTIQPDTEESAILWNKFLHRQYGFAYARHLWLLTAQNYFILLVLTFFRLIKYIMNLNCISINDYQHTLSTYLHSEPRPRYAIFLIVSSLCTSNKW